MKHRKTLLAALVAAVLLNACGGKSPEQLQAEGMKELEAGRYQAAVIQLKSALQANPENIEARVLLGRALQGQSEWVASEHELTRARQLGASAETILPLLMPSLLKQGKHKEVLALEIPKTGIGSVALATLRAQRALAHLALNQPDEAAKAIAEGEKVLTDAGQSGPHDDLDLARAGLALVQNKPDNSLALLSAIQERSPKRLDARYIKADLLRELGRVDEAAAEYQRILTARPDEIQAMASLADMQIRKGDLFFAEPHIARLEKAYPKALPSLLLRARLELRKGGEENLKKAQTAMQTARGLWPDIPLVLALSAEINERLGNHEAAFKDASQALNLNPELLESRLTVARHHLRTGQPKMVITELAQLKSAQAEDPNVRLLRGEAQLALGDVDAGIATLNQVAEQAPETPIVAILQARAYRLAGQEDKAFMRLEQASRMKQDQGQASELLIAWRLEAKQPDKALQAAEDYLRKQPTSLTARNLKAGILVALNRNDEARRLLDAILKENPDNFTAVSNLASLDLRGNSLGAAKQRFRNYLNAHPRHVEAMLALVNIARQEKDHGELVSLLEAAIKERPAAIAIRSQLIEHYLNLNDKKKALEAAKAATRDNPGSATAMVALARTQLASGDAPGALASYAQATALAPKSGDAAMLLGLAQLNHGKPKEARANLERAMQLGARKPDVFLGLITLETAADRLPQALELARRLKSLYPDLALALDREGELLLRMNRPQEALKPFRDAVARAPGMERVGRLHGALYASKQAAEADRLMAEWLLKAPKSFDLRFYLGDFLERTGKSKEAAVQYEAALALQPNHVPSLNNLAMLLHKSDPARALKLAEQALRLAPSEANVRDTLGVIVESQGDRKRAARLFEEAVKLAPTTAVYRYHLARTLSEQGRGKEALDALAPLKKAGWPPGAGKEAEALYVKLGGR